MTAHEKKPGAGDAPPLNNVDQLSGSTCSVDRIAITTDTCREQQLAEAAVDTAHQVIGQLDPLRARAGLEPALDYIPAGYGDEPADADRKVRTTRHRVGPPPLSRKETAARAATRRGGKAGYEEALQITKEPRHQQCPSGSPFAIPIFRDGTFVGNDFGWSQLGAFASRAVDRFRDGGAR